MKTRRYLPIRWVNPIAAQGDWSYGAIGDLAAPACSIHRSGLRVVAHVTLPGLFTEQRGFLANDSELPAAVAHARQWCRRRIIAKLDKAALSAAITS